MTDTHDQLEAIANAVKNADLSALQSWSDLDQLSTHTTVDDIEVDLSGIVINGDRFQAVANIYVTLQYGLDDNEGFHETDSFLAQFWGRVFDSYIEVDDFSVDNSSRIQDDVDL
jgi:hypothetical protein